MFSIQKYALSVYRYVYLGMVCLSMGGVSLHIVIGMFRYSILGYEEGYSRTKID